MKNLGKILFTLVLLQTYVYASVVASVDSPNVEFGDMVTLSLSIEGKDIKKPDVYSICGENVIATGSSTNMQYINGDLKKTYILSYKFIPKTSCVIEPLSISINGTIEKTLPIELNVKKIQRSKDSSFFLEMKINKKEVYVGEPFELTILFKQKKSEQVVDNKFTQPPFKGFWIKGEPKQTVEEKEGYVISKIVYQLSPQRIGELHISESSIKIAKRENTKNYFGGFFPQLRWRTYFSNDLNITSKALPNDVTLVGDFSIESSVDKTSVHSNEAVNLTVKLTGNGNLEDVKSFKPYLDGISIFDEDIKINKNILTQKITFVADSDFSIPALSLKIFDPLSQEVKIITTKPIEIHVKNAKQKEELVVHKENKILVPVSNVVHEGLNKLWLVAALILGIIIGILGMLMKPFAMKERKKKLDIKDVKLLLVKLMPYKEHKDVSDVVEVLEQSLYSTEKVELDKKVLKEIIKKYEIH